MLEKALQSLLGSKKIKPVNPKGNQEKNKARIIRNEREVTTDITEIQRIMKQLFTNKLNNLEGMDKNLRNTKYSKTESERKKQTEQINKKLNQC